MVIKQVSEIIQLCPYLYLQSIEEIETKGWSARHTPSFLGEIQGHKIGVKNGVNPTADPLQPASPTCGPKEEGAHIA